MLFVIPHQRTVQRSTHKRMSRADLYCFLLVLLVLLGIIADKVATHGIPAHRGLQEVHGERIANSAPRW